MKRMKDALAASVMTVCALTSIAASAETPVGTMDGEWMAAGMLDGSLQLWLNPHVVREENGMLRMWTRSDDLGKQARGDARVVVALVEVDCSVERVRYLQLNGYKDLAMREPMPILKPPTETTDTDSLLGWQYVRPSSAFELWQKAACLLGDGK